MKSAVVACGLAGLVFAGVAHADGEWPTRQPINLIVPAGPAGSADILSRLLAERMGKLLGQSVVILNRPGAGGNVGMLQAARAKPDGYTIAFSWTGPMATNAALYANPGFDVRKDFVPVGLIGCTPNVLAVRKDFPANSLAEFADRARAARPALSYGTTGVGSSWHLAAEIFNRETGNQLMHVPYTTPAAALTDLIGGRIDTMLPVTPMVGAHVQSGEIKVLATFSAERASNLPDVPTAVEQGFPKLLSETCYALLAPANTPQQVVDKLNGAMNDALSGGQARAVTTSMGLQVIGGEARLLQDYLDKEVPRQANLIKQAGATAM